jgi:deoxyribose-phosphate aldolase
MELRTEDIAKMMDLSCVRMTNTTDDIVQLVKKAKEYGCGQVSVLQCFLDQSRQLLGRDHGIKLVGNISFPSGSDNTELKVIQAKQMAGICDEVDMVMNICWLKSGLYKDVEEDVKAVKEAVGNIPLKVIIESPILENKQIEKACEICVRAEATFVKTGTGWNGVTTIEQVRLIKSVVGERILIKASGGVRNLDIMTQMYREGATRFGVNMKTGISIIKESMGK